MGLTQVSTDGVKDDAITKAKIPADQIEASELADNAVDTNAIANDAVTADKLANNSVDSNALQSLSVTANKIAAGEVNNTHIGTGAINGNRLTDETVTLAKLEHGTSSNNGKFLRANNGADPSFETIPASGISNLVEDTSPQLGNDLDTNSHNINLDDDHAVRFGDSNDLQIYHNNSSNTNEFTSPLSTNFRGKNLYFYVANNATPQSAIMAYANAQTEIYHSNSKKIETTSYGTKVTGYQAATSYVGFHVKVTGNNNGFGQNHGSGLTTYDTDYYSPIPMFNSRVVGFGNSYLQFPSYAGGEYIKFTAPVQGLYHFSLSCSWETHHGGDWLVVGWERNMTSSNNNGVFQNNGVGVSGVFERSSVDSGGPSTLTTVIWLDVNDTAVLYQQSTQAVRWKSNEVFVRGYLI